MVISAEIRQAQAELLRRRAVSAETISPAPNGWMLPVVQQPAKLKPNEPPSQSRQDNYKDVIVMPDVAAALLRNNLAAAGRVWLLLRALDESGRGVLSIEEARQLLCEKLSDWRIVGWRQLRNLLREGNEIFWQRDKSHVWLRSQAKVAQALGVERFGRNGVTVPMPRLVGSIGQTRAVLFATVHAGRETPISRAALEEMTGACEESQRGYERESGIRPKAQYAVLPNVGEDILWQHGAAGIEIIDSKGLHGPAGKKVFLRRLPNCYDGNEKIIATRMRRRLNRTLGGLLDYGGAGNGWRKVERRYCVDGINGRYFRSGQNGVWYRQEREIVNCEL